VSVAEYSPPRVEESAADPRRGQRGVAHAVRALGLFAAVGVLALVVLLSVWIGTRDIPFATTWNVLWHNDGSSSAVIIHSYRIPRTLLGFFVGAALGLSGALMQALTRNPLADPGLLGISLGASSGVVVAIAFLGIATVIGFVGLAVPHVARLLVGPDQRWVLPYSLVLAPILLLAADVLGRVIVAPSELQVAVVTAFLGAPVFIALCRRRKPVTL
jgi:iron complex transport system permease protein